MAFGRYQTLALFITGIRHVSENHMLVMVWETKLGLDPIQSNMLA
jgi:hypothetical protein